MVHRAGPEPAFIAPNQFDVRKIQDFPDALAGPRAGRPRVLVQKLATELNPSAVKFHAETEVRE